MIALENALKSGYYNHLINVVKITCLRKLLIFADGSLVV